MEQLNYSLEPREDILVMIPKGKLCNILDVGCANGVLGVSLKKYGAKCVVGIEKNQILALEAKNKIDRICIGDVEVSDFNFKKQFFDVIICADVIEHLVEPELFLKKYAAYLKEDGIFVISIPNVQYYFVLWSLLMGDWKYTGRGIFDRTHLRFFTLKSFKRLLNNCGLKIIKINRNYRLREKYCSHAKIAKLLSLYFFRNFLAFQYVISVRKK